MKPNFNLVSTRTAN